MQINNLLMISLLGITLQVTAAPIQSSSVDRTGESSGLVGYEVFPRRQNNLGVPSDPDTLLRRDTSQSPGTGEEEWKVRTREPAPGVQVNDFYRSPGASQSPAKPGAASDSPANTASASEPAPLEEPAPVVSEGGPVAPGSSVQRTGLTRIASPVRRIGLRVGKAASRFGERIGPVPVPGQVSHTGARPGANAGTRTPRGVVPSPTGGLRETAYRALTRLRKVGKTT